MRMFGEVFGWRVGGTCNGTARWPEPRVVTSRQIDCFYDFFEYCHLFKVSLSVKINKLELYTIWFYSTFSEYLENSSMSHLYLQVLY